MRGAERFELQLARRRLLQGGEPVALGGRAYDLLVALWERRTRVVDKAELLELVWPGLVVEENNLQVQVGHLRKVLGADAIATVPGRGYRLTGDLEALPAGSASPAARPLESPGGALLQLLALIRDCEGGPAEPIDLRGVGNAIAACRRLLLVDRPATPRAPQIDAPPAHAPLDIDDLRKALTATCAALELRIAAQAASPRLGASADGPHRLPENPAGGRTSVEPPWE